MIDHLRVASRQQLRHVAIVIDRISSGQISAAHITLAGLAGHFVVAWLIVTGELVWSGIALIFFGLFDVIDGELARYQKKAGTRGMVLDASTDRIKLTILFTAAAYYLLGTDQVGWVWLVTLALGTVSSIAYLKAKAEVAIAIKNPKMDHHKLNRLYHEGLVDFDVINIIFILGLLSGQLLASVAVVAVLSLISLVERQINIMISLK